MVRRGEQIRRLKTDVEAYAAACRRAATEIRAVVDTLPTDRHKGQQHKLRLIAESLDAQAIDVTIEGQLGNLERMGLLGLLGQSRVVDAAAVLTAVGTLAMAGIGMAGLIANANAAVETVNVYNVLVVDEANEELAARKMEELRNWSDYLEDFRTREGLGEPLSDEERKEIAWTYMSEGDNAREWEEAGIDHDDRDD